MQKKLEAKFLDINKDKIRRKLTELGFECIKPEGMMRRKAYGFGDENTDTRKWARVRDEGDKITMTIKEITHITDINGTYETEIVINDFETGCNFLTHAGLKQKAYQETYREKWYISGIEACIDTWPGLNPFIEVEGESEELICKYSELLGFDFANAKFCSVDYIYEEVMGIPKEEMCKVAELTFENPPKSRIKK